ncbi:MAG: ferric iron uptake transcriptional regulator [Acinetobacter sp.]
MAITNEDLRKAGLKITLPRIKILEILEKSSQRHLSAEDIYKILLENGEDVGLATVYRVLAQFEVAGIVQRHNFDANYAVFEIKSEDSHDHLICQNTLQIIEFTSPEIQNIIQKVALEHNFNVKGHSLNVYGFIHGSEKT